MWRDGFGHSFKHTYATVQNHFCDMQVWRKNALLNFKCGFNVLYLTLEGGYSNVTGSGVANKRTTSSRVSQKVLASHCPLG